MNSGRIVSTVSVGGMDISGKVVRSAEGAIAQDVALAAGKEGTLTTRTDDDTGIITLGAEHGVTTDDTVDVYWSGGLRQGMDVTATDGTTITVDVGAGDVLPAQDTAVVVGVQATVDLDVVGDNVQMLAVSLDKRGHTDFQQAGGTSIKAIEVAAGEAYNWAADLGVTNPLASETVGKVMASCGEASAAKLKIGVLYDSA